MTQQQQALFGSPKHPAVRVYDSPKFGDRYTAVLTQPIQDRQGKPLLNHRGQKCYSYIGMSSDPFHPQGIGQHGECNQPFMSPNVGQRLSFTQIFELPEPVLQCILQDLQP